jgi:hypothetical protein
MAMTPQPIDKKKAPLKPIKMPKPKNLRELKITPAKPKTAKPIIKTAMKKKVI